MTLPRYSSKAYVAAKQRSYQEALAGSNPVYSTIKSTHTNVPSTEPVDNTPAWLRGLSSTDNPVGNVLSKAASPTNPVGQILDLLSRTAYGSGALYRETKEKGADGFQPADLLTTAGPGATLTFLKGAFGDKKELPSQVLFEGYDESHDASNTSGAQIGGRFVGGLAMDILADPLTYAGGLGTAKLLKKIPGVGKASATVDKLSKTTPVGKRVLTSADEVVDELPVGAKVIPEPAAIVDNVMPTPEIPAVKPASEALLDTLPKEAVTVLDKAAEGKLVPSVTPKNAAILDVSKTLSEGAPEIAKKTVIRSTKTGEVVENAKRSVLNLKHAERVYSDDLLAMLPKMHTKIDDLAPEASTVVEAPKAASKTAELNADVNKAVTSTKAHTFDEWVKVSANTEINFPSVVNSHPAMARTIKDVLKTVNSKSKKVTSAEKRIAATQLDYLKRTEYIRYLRETQKRAASEVLIDAAPTGTAKSAELAAASAARADAGVRWVRKRGPELEAAKTAIREAVSDEALLKRLFGKPGLSKQGFDSILAEMRSATVKKPSFVEEIIDITPTKIDDVVNVSDSPLEVAKADVLTPAQRMDNASTVPADPIEVLKVVSGANLSDGAKLALEKVSKTQGWLEDLPDFVHESGRGAKRNSVKPGEGLAYWKGSYNAKAQLNVAQTLFKHYGAEVKAAADLAGKSKGWVYADEMLKRVRADLHAIDEVLLQAGVIGTATVSKGGIPLTLANVMDAMLRSKTATQVLKGRIFSSFGFGAYKGGMTSTGVIDIDALLTGAHTIVENIIDPKAVTRADLELAIAKAIGEKGPAIRKAAGGSLQATRKVGDKEVKGITQKARFFKDTGEPITGYVKPEILAARGVEMREIFTSAEQAAKVISEVVDALMRPEVLKGLVEAVFNNSFKLGLKFGSDVQQVSRTQLETIMTAVHHESATISDVVHAVNNTDEAIKAAAKASPTPISDGAPEAAIKAVNESLTDMIPLRDADNISTITAIQKALDAGISTNKAAQAGHVAATQSAFAQFSVTELLNSARNADIAMQASIFSKMAPLISKLSENFVAHSGNATLHSALTRAGSVGKIMQKSWRADLNSVDHMFKNMLKSGAAGPDDLKIALAHLQGKVEVLTDSQAALANKLKSTVQQIFESSDSAVDGVSTGFFRNGFSVESINTKFGSARYGVSEAYRFSEKAAKAAAKKNGTTVSKELAEQWRTWDITDPLDFMARMEHVYGSLATDMGIAQEAARMLDNLGLSSSKRIKGYVQIDDPASHTIARYFTEGKWYDAEIVKELDRMDDILKQSETFNSPFGRFVNNSIDPILNMWKSGMTVWRPGHHVRNFIGDSSLSFYADGVANPLYYKRAMQMQKLRGKYEGWDAIQALRGDVNYGSLAVSENVAANGVLKGGTKVKFTMEEVHRRLMDGGVLPDFRIQEDLLESSMNPSIAKFQRRMQIFDGKAKQTVGRISEARDDTVRIAHALHILENSKGFSSTDELFSYAIERVRKYHPDGADLTGFERKYMRRTFPFYSWTRKALPLVIESMLMEPGRVMMYPKAAFNFAKAQGIDLQSIGVPFPEDQLFPDFLEENTNGPIARNADGEYYGISPGLPTMDVLSDFVPGDLTNMDSSGDVLRSALKGPISMLSPFIKGPIESLTSTNAGTGGKIWDTGEYLDSQIPGVSNIASYSGYSPSGTLANALPGGDSGLDEQRAVVKGNKNNFDSENLINYLLGMQVSNMSKPSYINMAELEKAASVARANAKNRG